MSKFVKIIKLCSNYAVCWTLRTSSTSFCVTLRTSSICFCWALRTNSTSFFFVGIESATKTYATIS